MAKESFISKIYRMSQVGFGPMSINRVDDNVFISGYLPAADADTIKSLGITRIVKMFKDSPNYYGGQYEHPGVTVAVFPAEDRSDYNIHKDAVGALKFIFDGVRNNELILVHCHAGVSRSATVVLMYLMIRYKMPLDEALMTLKNIRPIVNPNSGFMAYLRCVDRLIN